jgi:hypothetical protein
LPVLALIPEVEPNSIERPLGQEHPELLGAGMGAGPRESGRV